MKRHTGCEMEINASEAMKVEVTPTPLVNVPSIAEELGVGHVLVKDESNRLGLFAFKILGASWAIFCTLCEILELDSPTASLDDLLSICSEQNVSLWATTDGNHGRAVAKVAVITGARAVIYVPNSVSARSQGFIIGEGAEVIVVDGDYDQAVVAAARAVEEANSPTALFIQDTAWDSYDNITMEMVIGYTTMFTEIDQLRQAGLCLPTLVVVLVGVVSLAHAAVLHYRSGRINPPPSILTPTTIATGETIMPGLNCGTVSSLAWLDLVGGVDVATMVSDQEVDKSVHDLAVSRVSSGPYGAATIATLCSVLGPKYVEGVRQQPEIGNDAVVVVISSESGEVYLSPATEQNPEI
ncbi:tryptophan synthase beta subunit-like PLP-dependent enzyme [Ceratobasidium sp. AG-I]|nr:tryptophan synthase beta subunit-like PLP-dependent enzyme [Ceratobasidium sp. AG-I]